MAAVGGCHDGALVVKVREPAEDGRATRAALLAVAKALSVPRECVRLARGQTSRRKLVEVSVDDDATLLARIAHLLGQD